MTDSATTAPATTAAHVATAVVGPERDAIVASVAAAPASTPADDRRRFALTCSHESDSRASTTGSATNHPAPPALGASS